MQTQSLGAQDTQSIKANVGKCFVLFLWIDNYKAHITDVPKKSWPSKWLKGIVIHSFSEMNEVENGKMGTREMGFINFHIFQNGL